ncbi:hypothetical protein EXS54_02865 [Patescibacteria group bacterium]|nr:hypothetical protein [Patescibacteria group bacterium]
MKDQFADDLSQFGEATVSSRLVPLVKKDNDTGLTYKVIVDDNFHFMKEEERYTSGSFATYPEALDHCKEIVDRSVVAEYAPGMTAEQLNDQYKRYGEDPWIDGGSDDIRKTDGYELFSAWKYAEQRCKEIVGQS